jgi:Leucine-rich repeat (LRR) protein
MSLRSKLTCPVALTLISALLIAQGCGKLRTPDDDAAQPVDVAEPAPPPVGAVPDQPPPTPEEIVTGFVALPPTQKDDAKLSLVAEQSEQIAGLEELVLGGSIVSDQGAALLPRFTGLKRLHLSGSRISGRALEYVAEIPSLEVLGINGVAIEDASLKPLLAMPNLKELSLAGTSIGEGAFQILAGLEHLEVLDVSSNDQVLGRAFSEMVKQRHFGGLRSLKADGSGFGYYGLQELGSLHNLEYVSVASSSASDDGLKGLRTSNSIRTLRLNNNKLTSAGMEHLKRLTQLEELWLGGNPAIGDDGLKDLRGLRQLRELSLDGTGCTEAGVRELKDRFLKTTLIRFGGQEL